MATKKTTTTEAITIPAINIQFATVKVVGDSPLIMHAWSQKAKQQILDKQMKKATKGRESKNPVEDYIESMYWLDGKPEDYTEEACEAAINAGARFGFPSTAFKASAVAAAYRSGAMKNMVTANGAFHIMGDMVEINGTPVMREDMVRIAMGGTDIRYRGEFGEWNATFTLRYNANVMSLEQILNAFNLGGFACGIGEYRPEKGGQYGMYHVAGSGE